MKDNSNEIFPIVDNNGNVIGSATRGECHSGSKLLHPVVHLQVYNSKGELYLQKRPLWKDIQPGKWDTAVGGHIDFGESVEDALAREAKEELGISGFTPQLRCKYIFESAVEHELVYSFSTIYNGTIAPTAELDGGKFWSKTEIEDAINSGNILTPNFEREYKEVLTAASQLACNLFPDK